MDSTVVYLVHLACCTSCAPLSPPASCPLWEAAAVRAVGEYHRHVSKGAAIQHFRADTDKTSAGKNRSAAGRAAHPVTGLQPNPRVDLGIIQASQAQDLRLNSVGEATRSRRVTPDQPTAMP